MKHVLEASSIELAFDERRILSDVYLRVETGEVVAIVGRNGQGKSSLLRAIYGTLRAEKHVRIDGRIAREAYMNPGLLRYLPQHDFLPGRASIARLFRDFGLDPQPFVRLFPAFGEPLRSRLDMLSGGWQRTIATYLILRSDSRFVLLDEPFTHLSPLQCGIFREIIAEERARKGIVLTDHMLPEVLDIADSLYILDNGALIRARAYEDLVRYGYVRR